MGSGENPKNAVHEFLRGSSNFVNDEVTDRKMLTGVTPAGYLRGVCCDRIKIMAVTLTLSCM